MTLTIYLCLLSLQLFVAESSLPRPFHTVMSQTRRIRMQTKYTGGRCCFAITTSVRCDKKKIQSCRLRSKYTRIIALPSPPTTLSVTASDNDATRMLQSSSSSEFSRRKAIISAMAGLSAEEAWCRAVAVAATSPIGGGLLPPGAIETIESGKALVVENWLPPDEVSALRADVRSCYDGGYFKSFVLSRNPKKADRAANDRWIMPSFSLARGASSVGPFADPDIGNFRARQNLKARMAMVKATLSKELHDRPTLASDVERTHEIEYLRYGVGAYLQRHTDEHHVELKRLGGSRLPKRPGATRRSITWLVFLNEENWSVETGDGGQLRLHERAESTKVPVGASGPDLQVGWLRGGGLKGFIEQPVFLDALRTGPDEESCVLYVFEADGTTKRDLTKKPFANAALYLGGGDSMVRGIMVNDPIDAARLHLIDSPKSLVKTMLTKSGGVDDKGEDGGEQVRNITPKSGTLVMFDSVSLPHEVLQTNRERFGIQGWFHEKLYT